MQFSKCCSGKFKQKVQTFELSATCFLLIDNVFAVVARQFDVTLVANSGKALASSIRNSATVYTTGKFGRHLHAGSAGSDFRTFHEAKNSVSTATLVEGTGC